VRNIALGEITAVDVLGQGFASLTGQAEVHVLVANTDSISGSFDVGIRCLGNHSLLITPARTHVGLEANEIKSVNFTVRDSALSGSNGTLCSVWLGDPNGKELGGQEFNITSSATQIVNDFDNQTVSTEEYDREPDVMEGDCKACASFLDLWCLLWNYECSMQKLIAGLVASLLLCCLPIYCVKKCLPCKFVKWLFTPSKKKETDEDSKEQPK